MFGIEDLDRLTKFPEIFVNKIMPDFDFGAVTCWYEKMFNRTYLEEPTMEKLNKNYYLSLPHVRFCFHYRSSAPVKFFGRKVESKAV